MEVAGYEEREKEVGQMMLVLMNRERADQGS